ncbi:hypothetical protein SERLA73DRAFT_125267 [Serpula lacrymans var. lacrymans S7.3]|uniref:Uncharacterized protein n=1 Tax=Serpula lacrymans var. lacrymans (strain S7.3) TaxID=936435 RepID=F8Q5J4_SERL3|nr:hypothetical protein SERLA73DRAFT_125267 [Serpula lacrymans var. lacrymans S7.3]
MTSGSGLSPPRDLHVAWKLSSILMISRHARKHGGCAGKKKREAKRSVHFYESNLATGSVLPARKTTIVVERLVAFPNWSHRWFSVGMKLSSR